MPHFILENLSMLYQLGWGTLFVCFSFFVAICRKFCSILPNEVTGIFEKGCVLSGSQEVSDSGSDLAGESQACTSHLCSTGIITWLAPEEFLCLSEEALAMCSPACIRKHFSVCEDRTLPDQDYDPDVGNGVLVSLNMWQKVGEMNTRKAQSHIEQETI